MIPLLLPALAAAAQEPPAIVITGRGLGEGLGEEVYDVVEIGRERLAASPSNRLEDVLRDVPGFQQFRRSDARSANPTSQGATLRALGGNASSRALLILDGVPQSDPFGGWISWPAYDPRRLARVRVVRGGGSGAAGPGALAGTIELESAGASEATFASLAHGSRDGLDGFASAGMPLGRGFATLSASWAQGDGFVPVVEGQRGPADRPAPYRQGSVAVRAVTPLSAATELQAGLLAFTDRRERGTAFSAIRTDGADASLRLVGRGRLPFSMLAYVQTRDFANSFAAVDSDRIAADRVLLQYSVPSTGLGAVELRLGSDWRETEGRTQELFLFAAGEPGRGGWEPTGRLGAAWRVARPLTLRAAAYLGWRLPTLNELYRPFRVGADATAANAALAPERSKGIEAGLDLRPARGVRIGLTAFANRLDGAISNVTLGEGPGLFPGVGFVAGQFRQRRNVDSIVSRGIEVDGSVALGRFRLTAGYSFADAELRARGEAVALDGLRPAQAPRHSAAATLAWNGPRGAAASITARYAGSQYEDDLNRQLLPDALTFDAFAALPLTNRLAIEVRGENLTDERVVAGISGAGIVERATPRTLWIGLRWRG